MKWHYTNQNDFPQPRAGKGDNDEFQCLGYDHGQYILLYWNCHYECWDDEQGDDYYCDKDKVEKWCYLDDIVKKLNAIEQGETKND